VVEKINSEPGDTHPDGTRGKVLGPLGIGYYFIAWDEKPRARWLIPEAKIKEVAAVRSVKRPGRELK
jgi:hypothetical protein